MPQDLDQQLESAKRDTLVETNAQAIFQNLEKLKALHEIHRRRWIWELLQNAADAADPSTRKNRVRIDAEGGKIRFSHNGSAFNLQEICHLIYHGSTKQEDETKKGKFGSGFLTIHLVSHRVRIRGVLEENASSKSFEFFLDRSGDAPRVIQQNMEIAWTEFKRELRDTDGTEEFTTTFECELDSDAEVVVESGLADLERTVPYVLAFVDELEEVTLCKANGIISWHRVKQESVNGLILTDVMCEISGAPSKTVRVATVGDCAKGVALAVLLHQSNERWEVTVDDSTPRLFYPLPLVDTHDLPIPFAIVSENFEPTEERNGIWASAAGKSEPLTEKNWALLLEVPLLFKMLVNACFRERWLASHKLARLGKAPANKAWLDATRFDSEVLFKVINFLRSKEAQGLVCAADDELLPVCEALIPVKDTEGKLYKLAEEIRDVKNRLPNPRVVAEWASILEGWATVMDKRVENLEEALTAEKLADKVVSVKTLHDLAESLTVGAEALAWLNRLLGFVPTENLQAFIRARTILPNQRGQFKKEGELRLDNGIEEGIKDICEKFGDLVRSELLHERICQPVRELFEEAKGRTISNDDCVERALKRAKEEPTKENEEAYAEANALLLRWLIDHDFKDKLAGYTVLCSEGRCELRNDKPLLAPVELWEEGAKPFADLFPDNRRLNDKYTTWLTDSHWLYLEEKGLVLRSFFVMEQSASLDADQVDGSFNEETDHKLSTPANISQIAFLKGDEGVLDGSRKSKTKAKRFLQFLLQYVIKADRSWINPSVNTCSCGQQHRILPAWMLLVKMNAWIPVGQRSDRPTAENLSKLLDGELKQLIFKDSDCGQFLLRIGIGLSDLARIGVPEGKKFQLDQLSARLYASADDKTVASIEAVMNNPDIRDSVLKKQQEIERVERNQKVGRTVEALLRSELEGAGIRVKRTGVGSDFEVETDFVENGQEQILEVSRYLLEVKSTSMPFARMTLRQGEEAIKTENRERYALCVVDVASGEINEQMVRDNARFVFSIGSLVENKVNDARKLKDHEEQLSPSSGGAVEIDIVESSVKLRIGAQVWLEQGVSFQQFVEQVKQVTVVSTP